MRHKIRRFPCPIKSWASADENLRDLQVHFYAYHPKKIIEGIERKGQNTVSYLLNNNHMLLIVIGDGRYEQNFLYYEGKSRWYKGHPDNSEEWIPQIRKEWEWAILYNDMSFEMVNGDIKFFDYSCNFGSEHIREACRKVEKIVKGKIEQFFINKSLYEKSDEELVELK